MTATVADRNSKVTVPAWVVRWALVAALLALFVFFSFTTSSFLTAANLRSVLVNNVALSAIVALAMTAVVASGGIDLSVGVAVDLASLAFVTLLLAHQPFAVALVGAVAAGSAVGLFNAVLVAGLRIPPFLGTLGTLFIGRSVQQLLTGGGNPVYLSASAATPVVKALGRGALFGVPVALVVVAILVVVLGVALARTRFGRTVTVIGAQPTVAWYSGLAVPRTTALVFVASAALCAVAGILLSATVNVYVPYSGNAFLLNAIGATFLGTTTSRDGRPTVLGTVTGVVLLGVVANGLLLSGLNYYWQQVGTGLVILAVLAMSFLGRRSAR